MVQGILNGLLATGCHGIGTFCLTKTNCLEKKMEHLEVDWNFQLNQTVTNDCLVDESFVLKFEF